MTFTPRFHYRSGNKQQGVGLIEVLIAVLILAIGLLGIAALQAITLKNAGGSAERTQAVVQAYNALDMLRANKAGAEAGTFNAAWGAGSGTDFNTVAGWQAGLQATVGPTAEGRIECGRAAGGIRCTVGVRWDESRTTGGTAAQTFEITSVL